MDMSTKDYDGRTALHVAAAEGHLALVRMLIEKCRVHFDIKDRHVLALSILNIMIEIIDGS